MTQDLQQQTILRDAMRRLNMTRDAFASRIGVTRRALDTWLLPDESPESRARKSARLSTDRAMISASISNRSSSRLLS